MAQKSAISLGRRCLEGLYKSPIEARFDHIDHDSDYDIDMLDVDVTGWQAQGHAPDVRCVAASVLSDSEVIGYMEWALTFDHGKAMTRMRTRWFLCVRRLGN